MELELGRVVTRASVTSIERLPADRVVAMLQACAHQIREVATVDDARDLADVADAFAAMTKRLALSKEIKKDAVRLVVYAEKRLGVLMKKMPLRTQPGKCKTLAAMGIDKRRMSSAQQLAKVPDSRIDKAIDGGASTLHAIHSALGTLPDNHLLREKRMSSYKLLAEEAVGLLERSAKQCKVPHSGTVAEMVTRLRNLHTTGPKT